MNGLFLFLATFLAATIDGVEMAAILVGVATARGWRSTILGAVAGFALLTVLTVVLRNTSLPVPIQALRMVSMSIAASEGPSLTCRCTPATDRSNSQNCFELSTRPHPRTHTLDTLALS